MGALPWLAWHRLNFFLKWQHTLLGWLDEVVTSTMSFNKHLMFLFPPSQGRALEVLSLGPCAPAGVWCGPFLSSTPRVRRLGTGTAVRSPVWTSGFLHLLRLPLGMGRAGGGGSWVWVCNAKARAGPACSRKVMNVCVCQLPVCLLELCKQLWLHALETLPNDRLNPQGKQAFAVKDYINVLRSPSTARWISWSFSHASTGRLLVARTGKHQRGPFWDHPDAASPSFPGADPPHPTASSVAPHFGVHAACAGELDREFQRRQAPQHPPGGLGGRAIPSMALPHSSGVCPQWQPGLTWDLGSFGMWAEERKGCRIHMA